MGSDPWENAFKKVPNTYTIQDLRHDAIHLKKEDFRLKENIVITKKNLLIFCFPGHGKFKSATLTSGFSFEAVFGNIQGVPRNMTIARRLESRL